MSTMREIAARAGVSAKTVSRVYTGDTHVRPETRKLVERIMRELNYVPNATATSFRSGRSPAIGVAVPDVVDPFFAAIARSVDEVARSRGLSTLVTSLGPHPENEQSILESLLSRKPAGLIVAPVGTNHAWLKRWVENTPIVFVDRAPVNLAADYFTDDDEGGALTATNHLLEQGHRRIAYIGGAIYLSTESKRIAGYLRALEDAGVPRDDSLIVAHVTSRDSAREAVARLRALGDPPTAIFSSNARVTMYLAAALLHNPLPIIGFGDFPLADLLRPSITVVDQSPAEIGRLAATRVFQRLDAPDRRYRRANVLPVTFIERESSRG